MKTCLTCSRVLFILFAILLGPSVDSSTIAAQETSVAKGHVSDVEGKAVQGAMVFAYTSSDVWKSADFISAPTDKDGLFRMVMPPGKYWLVARFKKTEGFGPLMPGDKHSGDPGEIELTSESEIDMDFVVADLKDAIRMKRDAMERPFKISGKIIDEKGAPVTGAYAIAYRKEISRIPDYLSAWVDNEGRYTLYIPEGTYSIGTALTFPPDQTYSLQGEMIIDSDKSGHDIVTKSENVR